MKYIEDSLFYTSMLQCERNVQCSEPKFKIKSLSKRNARKQCSKLIIV